jgi:hypothetical protein
MSSLRASMNVAQWDAMKDTVIEVAQDGPFDGRRATSRVLARGVSRYVEDFAVILKDVVDLEYLQPLPDEPRRWTLAQ